MEQYKSVMITGLQEDSPPLYNRVPFKVAVQAAIAPTTGFPIYGKYSVSPAPVADGQAVMIRTDEFGNIIAITDQIPTTSGVLRASGILPAAGAWDAAPTEINTASYKFLEVWINYLEGAATGKVSVMLEKQLPSGTWGRPVRIQPGRFIQGTDFMSKMQAEEWELDPIVVGSQIVTMTFEINHPAQIRMAARESGVIGTPGTCEIEYNLSD